MDSDDSHMSNFFLSTDRYITLIPVADPVCEISQWKNKKLPIGLYPPPPLSHYEQYYTSLTIFLVVCL